VGFTELLGLEHGIPAQDTFGAVYAAIDTDLFRDKKSFSTQFAGSCDGVSIAIICQYIEQQQMPD
jgi:hypothetical protein